MPPSAAHTVTLQKRTISLYLWQCKAYIRVLKPLSSLHTIQKISPLLTELIIILSTIHLPTTSTKRSDFVPWPSSSLFPPPNRTLRLLHMTKHNIMPKPPHKSPLRRVKPSRSTTKVIENCLPWHPFDWRSIHNSTSSRLQAHLSPSPRPNLGLASRRRSGAMGAASRRQRRWPPAQYRRRETRPRWKPVLAECGWDTGERESGLGEWEQGLSRGEDWRGELWGLWALYAGMCISRFLVLFWKGHWEYLKFAEIQNTDREL